MTEGIITKFCGKCKENLPASAFYKDKSKWDGLASQCKACRKAYKEANREEIAEYDKAYYEANHEKRKEQKRANYWVNREREKERSRTYRKANPEIRKAANHRHRARKRNAAGTHNSAQAQARFAVHGDSCIYCASTQDLQVEHLKPLNKGGSNWAANLEPACKSCNISKQDKWGADLLRWVEENCTVERTKKILGFVLDKAE